LACVLSCHLPVINENDDEEEEEEEVRGGGAHCASMNTPMNQFEIYYLYEAPIDNWSEIQGRFYIGAGGHRPPNVGQAPIYFGSNSKNNIRIAKI